MALPGNLTVTFKGQLLCEGHDRFTCFECLHSINVTVDKSGALHIEKWIDCLKTTFSVEPRFEKFDVSLSLLGLQDGLSPADRKKHEANLPIHQDNHRRDIRFFCRECGFSYLAGGGPGPSGAHPSHSLNGQRYIGVSITPVKFSRQFEKIECLAAFTFGPESKLNAAFACSSKSDEGDVKSNLANSEIAVLTQLLQYIEDFIVPYREDLVKGWINTNSGYFHGQAKRFQLVVLTTMDANVLDLLRQAHELKYSQKRKAFIKKNVLGLVTKRYPVTEERRYQVASFIRVLKHLAVLGISVFWQRRETSATQAAKKAFMNEPYKFRETHHKEAPPQDDESEVLDTDDELEGDSFDNMSDHDGFEAVKYESPRVDPADDPW
ncbi:hypothetical protein F4677DRAFT_458969 [Hypoxylon crocopeplum]|nr:hypothetical protein F4677DRAFT_458969 [Hypoxylon crocopeplum]